MKKSLLFNLMLGVLLAYSLCAETSYAQNWEPTNGPYGGSITCLAQNGSYLFAGTGVGIYGNGVFRSADNGSSWSKLNTIPNLRAIVTSGTYIVASCTNGIYRSGDNGDTWTACSYPGLYSPNALANDGTTLFAGGSSGFYVSTDNGQTWIAKNDNFPGITAPNTPNIQSFAISGMYLYAGTTAKGIFRSTDGGVTWITINTGLGTASQLLSRSFANLVVNGTDIFAGTLGQGIFLLLNNGTTWTAQNTGLTTAAKTALSLMVKDTYIYCGGNAGLWRSNNTGTMAWTQINATKKFKELLLDGPDVFAGIGTEGISLSNDNCITWNAVNQGIQGLSSRKITKGKGSEILAATYEGMIYSSSDEGANWTPGNTSAEAGPCLHDTSLFVGTNGDIFRSVNNGATWEMLPQFVALTFGPAYCFYSKGDTLFVGSSGIKGAYFSTDNGDTWQETTGIWNLNPNGGYPTVSAITSIGVKMYAATANGIFKSEDNGLTWVYGGTNDMGNVSILDVAAVGDYIFAATMNGVYLSTDNCLSWTLMNNGLQTTSVSSLLLNGSDIYAGTTAGVYKSVDFGSNWTTLNQGLPVLPYANSLYIQGNYLYTDNFTIPQPIYRHALSGTAPSQPGAISGSVSPCIGSSQTYSVPNVSGVTYAWQFPSGWSISAGGTSSSVTVTIGSTSGVVLVTPSNGWGSGPAQFLVVAPVNCLSKTLTLTSIFPEGLYAGLGTLNQANDELGAHWPAGVADHITVELHDAANYATIAYSAADVPLSTSGAATVTIPSTYNGSYYITIRHRNSLQTVSATAVSFAGGTISQSFGSTADVFGGNLVQMTDLGYAIYSGDVNQDDIIDLGDSAPVDNQAAMAGSGYMPEDVNGDGLVDLSDAAIIDNNAAQAVGAVTP